MLLRFLSLLVITNYQYQLSHTHITTFSHISFYLFLFFLFLSSNTEWYFCTKQIVLFLSVSKSALYSHCVVLCCLSLSFESNSEPRLTPNLTLSGFQVHVLILILIFTKINVLFWVCFSSKSPFQGACISPICFFSLYTAVFIKQFLANINVII